LNPGDFILLSILFFPIYSLVAMALLQIEIKDDKTQKSVKQHCHSMLLGESFTSQRRFCIRGILRVKRGFYTT
jgi:hypothetical protein